MSGSTGPTGPTGPTGYVGSTGNNITNVKLNSLNNYSISAEQRYVNSIIYQVEDVSLLGGTGFAITLPPGTLDPSMLFTNLTNSFVNCTVTAPVTAGITGYYITWT